MYRIGFGYDVHQFSPNRQLWLGGICIPSERGLLGHSDADVLLHALCDALLGSLAMRDIGYHFPDTKGNEYDGIDSKILLAQCINMVREQGYELSNADITVCAQAPKLSPYIDAMRESVARVLQVPVGCISIKATTTELLGFVGREEGIAAYATVLVYPKE